MAKFDKKLKLNRETIRELTPRELRTLAGVGQVIYDTRITCDGSCPCQELAERSVGGPGPVNIEDARNCDSPGTARCVSDGCGGTGTCGGSCGGTCATCYIDCTAHCITDSCATCVGGETSCSDCCI